MQKLPKIGLPIVLLSIVLLIFISKSSINIGYGEAGVLFKTFGGGVVTDQAPLGEGFHIIAPWNKVFIYNVKQQEFFEGNMQVLSSNGLEISLDVSVLYQPKYDELGLLHKTKGENYVNIVLIPQIRAVARSVVGRYTPEQLYSTKRDAIQNEIFEEVKPFIQAALDGENTCIFAYGQTGSGKTFTMEGPPGIDKLIDSKSGLTKEISGILPRVAIFI